MANYGRRMVRESLIKEIGQGSTYTAGTGIDITEDTISVDSEVVALKTDIPSVPEYTAGGGIDITSNAIGVKLNDNEQGLIIDSETTALTLNKKMIEVASYSEYFGSLAGLTNAEIIGSNWDTWLEQFPMWRTSHFSDESEFSAHEIVDGPTYGSGPLEVAFSVHGGFILRNTTNNVSIVVISSTKDIKRNSLTLQLLNGYRPFDGQVYFPDCRVRQICTVDTTDPQVSTEGALTKYGTIYVVCVGYSPADGGVIITPDDSTTPVKIYTKTYLAPTPNSSTDGTMTSLSSTPVTISNGTLGILNELQKVS